MPPIDNSKTRKQGKVEVFARALEKFFHLWPEDNVCDKLEHFKNAFHRVDLSIFGGKTNKTADWFESLSEKTPVADEKTSALSAYKACLSAVEALLGTTIVCDQV